MSVLAAGPEDLGLESGLAGGLVAEEEVEGLRDEEVVGFVEEEEEEGFEEDPFVVEEADASTFRFLLLPVGVERGPGDTRRGQQRVNSTHRLAYEEKSRVRGKGEGERK